MKGLILIALLALGVVFYLVMCEDSRPTSAPIEQPEPASTAIKVDIPPPPEPPKRTIEEIRADVAKKTADQNVIRPVSTPPKPDPMAERKAKRAEFQAKIDSLRGQLPALDSQIIEKQDAVNRLSARLNSYRQQSGQKVKQWRWVTGKQGSKEGEWRDINSLPSREQRHGKPVQYRDVPANSGVSSKIPMVEAELGIRRRELEELKSRRMTIGSDIANLGNQMNMVQ